MNTRTKTLMKLNELAWQNPELRLGQILVNSIQREGFTCPEIFYLTDEELLDSLADFEYKLSQIRHERG